MKFIICISFLVMAVSSSTTIPAPSKTPTFSFVREFEAQPNGFKVWHTDTAMPHQEPLSPPPPSGRVPSTFSFVREFEAHPNGFKVWNTDTTMPPHQDPLFSPPPLSSRVSLDYIEEKSSKKEDTSKLISSQLFINYKDLYVGFKLPIYFGGSYPNSSHVPTFLPTQYSSKIPFSSKQLPNILKYFGFAHDSKQAIAMNITIKSCEDVENFKAVGLFKRCTTSFNKMKALVGQEFGSHVPLAMRTSPLPKSAKLFQKYTILGIVKVPSSDMIACHLLMYPYAVYYCHHPKPVNSVYKTSLKGEDGTLLDNAMINCHMNTKDFSPNILGFKILGLAPGSPLCHFLPAEDYIWVKAAN